MADVNLIVKETLNVTCMRNDTFRLEMVWKDANDNFIDLTTYTFTAQVKKSKSDSTSILSFADSDFTKDSSGNLSMLKTSEQMNLEPGSYYYDLQAYKIATADVSTWLGGIFTIKDDVTR